VSGRGTAGIRRAPHRLERDPGRVVARLFVPGNEGFDDEDSRTGAVVARVLLLGDEEVDEALADVLARFSGRHRSLTDTFHRHAAAVADRLAPGETTSEARRLLIGATFTHEYAVEGAALCNPSIVRHPDQAGVAEGSVRFVMSVRAIGEGHRSSIGFRTGTADRHGEMTLDPAPSFATTGEWRPGPLRAATFRRELHRREREGENADSVLDALPERFGHADLEQQLQVLVGTGAPRHGAERTATAMREIAARTYCVDFPPTTTVAERILWPSMEAERNGMEDARFVEFTDTDGTATNYASYTAYDGAHISLQLLETPDFRTFTSEALTGPAAHNKGLALFPRRIGGRFAALSRWDRETNSVAFTDDIHHWPDATLCQVPTRSWEVLQLGNCGSPIETTEGWLVLTHGVGPMRTYTIGAILLDLDDPTVVRGSLREPLLAPTSAEQDGYVPNVVYSCGALAHGDHLLLPYGISDGAIGFATVALPDLVASLCTGG
jgi:predicted GH43/DUF377 family glycosyl hydrolase